LNKLWNTKIIICGENIVQVRHYEKIFGGYNVSNPLKKDFTNNKILDESLLTDEFLLNYGLERFPQNKLKYILENKIANYVEKPINNNISKEDINVKTEVQNGAKKRNKITNLINSNSDLKTFITLTFRENIKDFTYAYKCLNRFVKLMNKKIDFKYVVVVEFQSKNRDDVIHFHMLCNLPVNFKITKIQKRKSKEQMNYEQQMEKFEWSFGYVCVQPLSKNLKYNNEIVDNMGAYLVKYMTKISSNPSTFNKKMYSCSKNLIKPIEINILDLNWILPIDELGEKHELNVPSYENHYKSDFTGNVYFQEYNKIRQDYIINKEGDITA